MWITTVCECYGVVLDSAKQCDCAPATMEVLEEVFLSLSLFRGVNMSTNCIRTITSELDSLMFVSL